VWSSVIFKRNLNTNKADRHSQRNANKDKLNYKHEISSRSDPRMKCKQHFRFDWQNWPFVPGTQMIDAVDRRSFVTGKRCQLLQESQPIFDDSPHWFQGRRRRGQRCNISLNIGEDHLLLYPSPAFHFPFSLFPLPSPALPHARSVLAALPSPSSPLLPSPPL